MGMAERERTLGKRYLVYNHKLSDGAQGRSTMKCYKCDKSVPDQSKYCPSCGQYQADEGLELELSENKKKLNIIFQERLKRLQSLISSDGSAWTFPYNKIRYTSGGTIKIDDHPFSTIMFGRWFYFWVSILIVSGSVFAWSFIVNASFGARFISSIVFAALILLEFLSMVISFDDTNLTDTYFDDNKRMRFLRHASTFKRKIRQKSKRKGNSNLRQIRRENRKLRKFLDKA